MGGGVATLSHTVSHCWTLRRLSYGAEILHSCFYILFTRSVKISSLYDLRYRRYDLVFEVMSRPGSSIRRVPSKIHAD